MCNNFQEQEIRMSGKKINEFATTAGTGILDT